MVRYHKLRWKNFSNSSNKQGETKTRETLRQMTRQKFKTWALVKSPMMMMTLMRRVMRASW